MNKKHTFKRAISGVALAILLMSSSAVFAQVKIGTNPTSIDPANNLEVEASTTGRKTSIDKTTGQVTVKDGTEGLGKIFTSDAGGGASWQPAPGSTVIIGNTTTPTVIFVTPPATEAIVDFPITLNKGTYMLYYYAQFDYYTPGSTTLARTLDPTNATTLANTFPRYVYFNFVATSGAATFHSYLGGGPDVLPVVHTFQVAARVSWLTVVTEDNTVIKPKFWGIPAYGRIVNLGAIVAVKI